VGNFLTSYNPEDSNLHTHRRENLKSYWVWLGWVCYAHAYAQKIMATGVIIPSRDFEHQSRWNYRVLEVRKCELGEVNYGTTSAPIFIDSPGILYLLNAQDDISCEEV
jgi:hypothetical protein